MLSSFIISDSFLLWLYFTDRIRHFDFCASMLNTITYTYSSFPYYIFKTSIPTKIATESSAWINYALIDISHKWNARSNLKKSCYTAESIVSISIISLCVRHEALILSFGSGFSPGINLKTTFARKMLFPTPQYV